MGINDMACQVLHAVIAVAGDPSVGQFAFEQAGGLQAWRGMFEAGRQMERPANGSEKRCPTVPLSY